jgi:hypothetical protein
MSKQGWMETLISSQVDGPSLTTAARLTMLPAQAKKTIPANFFDTIGQQLQIKASGRITSAITTPGTARFDITYGGVIIFDSLAILLDTVAAHTNVAWDLEINLTLRVVGSVAQFFGSGKWISEDILGVPAAAPKGCLTAMLPWNTAPVVGGTFDATAAGVLDAFFTQTVGGGSLICHQFSAISPN